MSNATIAPVRRSVFVRATPERAFEVFTEQVASWWPASHSLLEHQVAVVVEPAEGGRWYERGPAGEECDWGRVLAYEPPRRLVLSWLLDERCRAWAAARPGPTLLVTTDPAVGLTEAHAAQLEAWAATA